MEAVAAVHSPSALPQCNRNPRQNRSAHQVDRFLIMVRTTVLARVPVTLGFRGMEPEVNPAVYQAQIEELQKQPCQNYASTPR